MWSWGFAVVTMAIETGRIKVEGNYHKFIIDCPCGPVTAYATTENHIVKSVSFENVPTFVYIKDFPIEFDNYKFNIDISYGELFTLLCIRKN